MKLLYSEIGPAWDSIAQALPGRGSEECRKRFHRENLPASIKSELEHRLLLDGYEYHQGRFIKIPVESAGSRTHLYLSYIPLIPYARSRSARRKAGWHSTEDMAIQEAHDLFGPNWEAIAKNLKHRTPTQCKNRLLRLYRHRFISEFEASVPEC